MHVPFFKAWSRVCILTGLLRGKRLDCAVNLSSSRLNMRIDLVEQVGVSLHTYVSCMLTTISRLLWNRPWLLRMLDPRNQTHRHLGTGQRRTTAMGHYRLAAHSSYVYDVWELSIMSNSSSLANGSYRHFFFICQRALAVSPLGEKACLPLAMLNSLRFTSRRWCASKKPS
jgi:hypothetical protein